VNYLDCAPWLHRAFAFHAEDRCNPLAQRARALRFRIELPGADAQPMPFHNHTNRRIAGAAGPDQVCEIVVFFVAIRVMRLDVSSRTTESSDTRPTRQAFWSVGAVACRAVCDLGIRLAPVLPASAQRIRAHHQLSRIFVTDRIFATWMEHLDRDPTFCVPVRRNRHAHTMRSGFHGLHVPAGRRYCHMLNGEPS
jgi:hypothetical protein